MKMWQKVAIGAAVVVVPLSWWSERVSFFTV